MGTVARNFYQTHKQHIPVMFLYGECDAEGTKKAINEFAQLIPDSKVLKIRNAGHFSAIENPTQFNAEVLKFCGNIQKRNRKP